MLGKLMKYELRATSRTMLPLLLLTLLLSVFTRMTSAVVQSGHSKFITVINTLLILAFFLALIGTAVFSVVLMVVRFRNNLMTDEGLPDVYPSRERPPASVVEASGVHALFIAVFLCGCAGACPYRL